MDSFRESLDIAGGFVSGTLTTLKNAPDVFGCKASWASTGNCEITLDRPIPLGRARVWASPLVPNPLTLHNCERIDDSHWIIQWWELGVAAGPALTETPTKFDFCFGVSVIPE